jgi:hypothetical protein
VGLGSNESVVLWRLPAVAVRYGYLNLQDVCLLARTTTVSFLSLGT